MKKPLAGSAGFSLIECIIIIAITALALVPIVNMYVQGVRGIDSGNIFTIGTNLAQLKMELVRQIPFSQLGSDPPLTKSSGGAGMEGYPDYNYQINLYYLDGGLARVVGPTNLREVEVIITHNSGAAITLTTVVANHT